MKGGRRFRLLDDPENCRRWQAIICFTSVLGSKASPPITVLCSWKLHIAGTWDSYEISLSDKEKLGLSSKCIYCAQEVNWEGNVYNPHQCE